MPLMRYVSKVREQKWWHVSTLHAYILHLQLYLLKRGGEEIYVGPIGHQASYLISFFEVRLITKCKVSIFTSSLIT
jgi:hypothetical protein